MGCHKWHEVLSDKSFLVLMGMHYHQWPGRISFQAVGGWLRTTAFGPGRCSPGQQQLHLEKNHTSATETSYMWLGSQQRHIGHDYFDLVFCTRGAEQGASRFVFTSQDDGSPSMRTHDTRRSPQDNIPSSAAGGKQYRSVVFASLDGERGRLVINGKYLVLGADDGADMSW